MAKRQASLAVKRAQHLYMLCNNPLSNIQGIPSMHSQVAIKNAFMPDEKLDADRELDNRETFGNNPQKLL